MEFNIIEFHYLPGKSNKVADALNQSVPMQESNSAPQGPSVIVLTPAGAAKLAMPSNVLSSEGAGSSLPLPLSPVGGTPRETPVSAKSTESTVSKESNECDECVGRPVNENIEWNVILLIRSQNNHPVWSKVKAHLKDASVPFSSECLLPKVFFAL